MYKDIHQWYLAVDEAVSTTEKYEDLILKFYKTLRINPDKHLVQPFLTKFYKKETFGSRAIPIAISKLGLSFGIAIVGFVAIWLFRVLGSGMEFIDAAKDTSHLVLAGILAGIIFVLTEILSVVLTFVSYKSIIKKFEAYEVQLHDIMVSLPSRYRNSERMSFIKQAYYSVKGIAPEAAFNVADQFDDARKRPFQGVFFDLPYKNNFVEAEEFKQGQQEVEKTEEEKQFENPNLPADIKSKTFSGSKDAKKDLDSMIGLESVKEQIEKLENRIKFYGNNNNGNHMQFLGSAGTGKTTVARIVTKILFDLGYIKKNQYVEISGDYLKAGNSARVDAIIEYSMGGVLFIDEAYLLYDKNGYSAEATGILLKAMEDHRSDFVVILAGYEEQMTRLIASNEGFSSRIKHTIYFPDYTEQEMLEIFKYFISNYSGKSYKISDNAIPLLLETFTLEKQVKSFGNARTVRNAVDTIMDNYADRSINAHTDTRIIEIEDVQKYQDSRKVFLQHEVRNSSASSNIDESIISLGELKTKVRNGSEDPDEDFSRLVQFSSFASEIEALKKQKEFYNDTKTQKILIADHYGSGVPFLVQVITGYLYKLGYISDNKYLQIDAEFLKGSYVGHTAKRANAIINYATGGVLFIRNISKLSDDTFSTEVKNAILEALDNDLTIIISDTELNPELFTVYYEVPKPDTTTLMQVFINAADEDDFTVQDSAQTKLLSMLNNKTIKDVLNIYEKAKKKHIDNFTEETKYIITEDDIEKPTIKLNIKH